MNVRHLAVSVAIMLPLVSVLAEVRVPKDSTGQSESKGELAFQGGGLVKLKKENGQIITVKVTSFSQEDQSYVKSGEASDRSQWRCPRRNEISPKRFKRDWPKDGLRELWAVGMAGRGYSGFSVQGESVRTMELLDAEERVLCLKRKDGSVVWESTIGPIYGSGLGDGLRSAPTRAGDRPVVLGVTGVVVRLNRAEGQILWSKSMERDLDGHISGWGYCESSLAEGGWNWWEFDIGEEVGKSEKSGKGCLTCVDGMLICLLDQKWITCYDIKA